LRKILPKLVTDAEIAVIKDAVRQFTDLRIFIVDVKEASIVIYLPSQSQSEREKWLGEIMGTGPFGLPATRLVQVAEQMEREDTFLPMMRFTLRQEKDRLFSVDRWCFKGSIDGWFSLGYGSLEKMVTKFCPHLGKESFFELF
jgi:hypothetical protein